MTEVPSHWEKMDRVPQAIKEKVDLVLFDLILDHPFIGYLSSMLRRHYVHIGGDFYAATDGNYLHLDPEKVEKLPEDQLKGLIGHEVIHCMLRHTDPERGVGYIHSIWSYALEFMCNHVAKDIFNLNLPGKAVYDYKYRDGTWTEEKIYDELLQKVEVHRQSGNMPGGDKGPSGAKSNGSGDQNPDGSFGCRDPYQKDIDELMDKEGSFMDDHSMIEKAKQDKKSGRTKGGNDWTQLVAQAASISRMRGKLPSDLARLVDIILKKKLDLRSLLANFCLRARNEYSWSRPNKRNWWRNIYTPARKSRKLVMGVAVDTSGSMGKDEVGEGLGIILEICQTFEDYELHLWGCDADVGDRYQLVTPGEDIDFKLLAGGGGGTDFRPVFKYVEDNDIQIEGLVYFTDSYGAWPEDPPYYEVLWIIKGMTDERDQIPWGDKIYIDAI